MRCMISQCLIGFIAQLHGFKLMFTMVSNPIKSEFFKALFLQVLKLCT